MRRLNNVSAVCFFLSSISLLCIPLLNVEDFSKSAYLIAGVFWAGLIAGTVLQIVLGIKTRKNEVIKRFTEIQKIIAIIFYLSIVSVVFVLIFLKTDAFALTINLFATLLAAQIYCVIKRLEKIH